MTVRFLTGSVRARVAWSLALVLGLAALAQSREVSAPSVARGLVGGLTLIAGAGWLLWRERRSAGFKLEEPLRVVSRTGLSPRCGVALVEVEGSRYLVAFGESFAEIRRTRGPVRLDSRSRRHASIPPRSKESLS